MHDDIQGTNVLALRGSYAAIIDWGDAGWADPALDLCYVPMTAVPYVLNGYREVGPMDADDAVEARVLWDHIWTSVGRLGRNRPGERILDLLESFATEEGRAWSRLIS